MIDPDLDINEFIKTPLGVANITQITFLDQSQVGHSLNLFNQISPNTDNQILLTAEKNYKNLMPMYGIDAAKAGIHVLRSYLAHGWHRQCYLAQPKSQYADLFHENGYYTISNFLGADQHAHIRDIVNSKAFPLAVHKGHDSMAQKSISVFNMVRNEIVPLIQETLPILPLKVEHMILESTFVQKLHNMPNDGDVQKVYHSDTFFPALKFWYFPNAVTLEDGPFMFVPNSARFDKKMAAFMLRESIKIIEGNVEEWRTYGHAEGSLRMGPDEIEKTYGPIMAMVVPANTLVVANVFGFHARGGVRREVHRNAIHGSVRTSTPFLY